MQYMLFFALGVNGEGFLFSVYTIIYIMHVQWWNSVRDSLLVIEAVPEKLQQLKVLPFCYHNYKVPSK